MSNTSRTGVSADVERTFGRFLDRDRTDLSLLVRELGAAIDRQFYFVLGYDGDDNASVVPDDGPGDIDDVLPGSGTNEERCKQLSAYFRRWNALLGGRFQVARHRSGMMTTWFGESKVLRYVDGEVELYVGLPLDMPVTPIIAAVDSVIGRRPTGSI